MYLTIATNFLDPMFPCEVRQQLLDNRFAKHLVILLVAFFWAAPDADYGDNFTVGQHVRNTLMIYVLYVASCKCTTIFLLPALALLVVEQGVAMYANKGAIAAHVRERHWLRVTALALIASGCAANVVAGDRRLFTIRCQ